MPPWPAKRRFADKSGTGLENGRSRQNLLATGANFTPVWDPSGAIPTLRQRRAYGTHRRASRGPSAADSHCRKPRRHCCRSSVVEHSLGKGEVDSSILSGSTSTPTNSQLCGTPPPQRLRFGHGNHVAAIEGHVLARACELPACRGPLRRLPTFGNHLMVVEVEACRPIPYGARAMGGDRCFG